MQWNLMKKILLIKNQTKAQDKNTIYLGFYHILLQLIKNKKNRNKKKRNRDKDKDKNKNKKEIQNKITTRIHKPFCINFKL